MNGNSGSKQRLETHEKLNSEQNKQGIRLPHKWKRLNEYVGTSCTKERTSKINGNRLSGSVNS